jgi:UDP-glucose 4-epimerase
VLLSIFGSADQRRALTYDDIGEGITSTMAPPVDENEGFDISGSEEQRVATTVRILRKACRQDPAAFELEHGASFEVDVQRRWPSVVKAERLLGWKARIGPRERIPGTVEWLRERVLAPHFG